ncbi:MAG: hypothetical protein E7329_01805 [Clostridiales bacterium]|nr:hypothetical protein [Clostridiales bacterium]
MLYPKNQSPHLSKELFLSPTSEYRGTPFWSWNCRLEEKELLWQLEMLKKMGMGGAHMHVRTGLVTPYLSNEHMQLIKSCVKKCREEGMLAWLYDEDRWPSGAAGGIVTKEKRHRAKHLLFTVNPYSDDTKPEMSYIRHGQLSRSNNGELIACYDIVLDEKGCLQSAKPISAEESCQGKKWYVYLENPSFSPWFNYQTYVDTLSPEAIERFVQVTHEKYLEWVGDDFGGAVPAIFTDEPQHTHKQTLGFAREEKDVILPWTSDVPETFQKAYGEDIMAHLPELLWELPDGQISSIRYHYHDHIAERFAAAFADTIGAWCEKHHLMSTGHLMLEGDLHGQTRAIGEAMRSYRSFQLPGVDMLNHRTEFTTCKQVQSAAHQYGREGVMSELYAVMGWEVDFRAHKFHGDWQAALGVTVRVPHLAWVTMKGESKRDYPAPISYQSPWWQDYSYLEDHYARVATAMTRGESLVRVGVIHPIESYWLHWGPEEQTGEIRRQMDKNFQNVTEWLINGNIDFDFICEALLPELCCQGGAPLQVGKMAYDAIVVPGCETLRASTLDRLEAFQKAGGQLIFLGEAPRYANALPSSRGKSLWQSSRKAEFCQDALLGALESVRTVDIRDSEGNRTDNLIHQLRKDGEARWLFIAHSKMFYHRDVPIRQDIRITLNGEYNAVCYDTQTGEIYSFPATHEKGKTVVQATLYDTDSLLLRYTNDVVSAPPAPKTVAQKKTALPIPQRVAYRLDEPNVYLMDKAEFSLDNGPYRSEKELYKADDDLREELGWYKRQSAMAQPWVIPEKEPEHKVHLRFTVHCTQSFEKIHLALEDADLANISLNGQSITAQPDGWYVDKSIETVPLGTLQKGENIIEITLPFGKRTNVEWCYLLGDFGVRLYGEYRELVPLQPFLGFDDITAQGLPHYGGNITYLVPIQSKGGKITISVPHYSGAAIRAKIGDEQGYIVYAPYQFTFEHVAEGKQMLELTLLGHRHNAFGPVHLADPKDLWIGPNAWRTTDEKCTGSYRLKPVGIRSAPLVEEE